ncbi:phosphocholine cytidylyltransferase family protein [Halalkalibacter alkaliphilus]|uniref:Phosphocholine cytidylyltransferase family protein n=1 Tax=Halalkalibacter alkaliphilus TaxID=2917993 RepID=A0A9X2CUU7_9BACI|nr:phosphocholine cytidylyltransferase family protein [Halalkalibacter alkaliphilus]MCL7748677.1 phosphocholine cytidylyltransferase family protein [Halalkalibacter alkaliphilus]
MVTTAVILAAGRGKRLNAISQHIPKGLLVIEKKSIIEESIDKLLAAGITNIQIGAGYKEEKLKFLEQKYPGTHFTVNRHFSTSGNLYTLLLMKEQIKEDFLLLESDIIYEKRALREILDDSHPDVILASDLSQSGDEFFIESNDNHLFKKMKKQSSLLSRIDGEFVGISKISYPSFKLLCQLGKKMFENDPMIDYEEVLNQTAKHSPFFMKKVQDLAWCEIDNEEHLKRATLDVYPRIKEKDISL